MVENLDRLPDSGHHYIYDRVMRYFFLRHNELITRSELELKFFPDHPNPESNINELISRVRHDEAPKRNGSLFTVSGYGYVYLDGVYEPGAILRPEGLMPDPDWLSRIPFKDNISELLGVMRYATVMNQTEALPRLTPPEFKVFLELTHAYGDQSKMSFFELDLRLQDMKPYEIVNAISAVNGKIEADTSGEWHIMRERHGKVRDNTTYSLVQR